MLDTLLQSYATQMQNIQLLLMVINALVHIIFAGAVARDGGALYLRGRKPALVSAYVWSFATLIGGVVVAAIYWFIHHSTLTINSSNE